MRVLIAVAMTLLYAGRAHADIVPPDPDMELDSSSSDPAGSILFNADEKGGGIFFFTNTSSDTWIGITFTFPQTQNVHCLQSNLFAFCSATSTSITYSGIGDTDPNGNPLNGLATGPDPDGDGDDFHGIGPGQSFTINLNDNGSQTDGGHWAVEESFTGTPQIAAPEPQSIGLALFTIAAAFGLTCSRRRKKC